MRSQTVHRVSNHRFYSLLEAFESLTGYPLLVNISFNVRVSRCLIARGCMLLFHA